MNGHDVLDLAARRADTFPRMSEDPISSGESDIQLSGENEGDSGNRVEPISIEQFHRKMAVELFNAVWGLLEKEDRNCAETDRMIHAAHASRFHWEIAGAPVNWGIGE